MIIFNTSVKGVLTFQNRISQKINVVARVEFELTYKDVTGQHDLGISHDAVLLK